MAGARVAQRALLLGARIKRNRLFKAASILGPSSEAELLRPAGIDTNPPRGASAVALDDLPRLIDRSAAKRISALSSRRAGTLMILT